MGESKTAMGVPRLITVGEAARVTGLTPHIVRSLCNQSIIEAHRVLGHWRISRISLERYMFRTSNLES